MKFSLLSSSFLFLSSAAYAAPNIHQLIYPRETCGDNSKDCQCSAKFDKLANPASLGSTVSSRISGQDSGLTTSDWEGSDGQGQPSVCKVAVNRVCGDCFAWKTTTQKCGQYGLSSFACVPV